MSPIAPPRRDIRGSIDMTSGKLRSDVDGQFNVESPKLDLNAEGGSLALNPVAPPRSPKTLKVDVSRMDTVDLSDDVNASAKVKTPEIKKEGDEEESSSSFLAPLKRLSSRISSYLSANEDEDGEKSDEDKSHSSKRSSRHSSRHSSKRNSGVKTPTTKEEEDLSAKLDAIVKRGIYDIESTSKKLDEIVQRSYGKSETSSINDGDSIGEASVGVKVSRFLLKTLALKLKIFCIEQEC